jgi:hypothetical protein
MRSVFARRSVDTARHCSQAATVAGHVDSLRGGGGPLRLSAAGRTRCRGEVSYCGGRLLGRGLARCGCQQRVVRLLFVRSPVAGRPWGRPGTAGARREVGLQFPVAGLSSSSRPGTATGGRRGSLGHRVPLFAVDSWMTGAGQRMSRTVRARSSRGSWAQVVSAVTAAQPRRSARARQHRSPRDRPAGRPRSRSRAAVTASAAVSGSTRTRARGAGGTCSSPSAVSPWSTARAAGRSRR